MNEGTSGVLSFGLTFIPYQFCGAVMCYAAQLAQLFYFA